MKTEKRGYNLGNQPFYFQGHRMDCIVHEPNEVEFIVTHEDIYASLARDVQNSVF